MPTQLTMDWVTDALDQLMSAHSGVLLQMGNDLLVALAVTTLIIYSFKHGLHGGLLLFLTEYIFLLLIAGFLLRYYVVPIPFIGLSFHQLFPALAQDIAITIDVARMDVLFSKINAVLDPATGMKAPGALDFAMLPVYWLVEFGMWLIEAFMFIATAIGYIALGIGNLVGPIFIPFLIVPFLAHLFWNWMTFIWQYSFYRVAAAALLFVLSTMLNDFMDWTVHGDYSLGNWMMVMPEFIVGVLVSVYAILRLSAFVSDMFKGTSSAGSNVLAGLAVSSKALTKKAA